MMTQLWEILFFWGGLFGKFIEYLKEMLAFNYLIFSLYTYSAPLYNEAPNIIYIVRKNILQQLIIYYVELYYIQLWHWR